MKKDYNLEKFQSLSSDLLEDTAFFFLLPHHNNFFLLKKTLSKIKEGEQLQYQNFMKKFDQSPKDKDSYKKSMDIIKSKLFDNLYKNFTDDIDYEFAPKFVK